MVWVEGQWTQLTALPFTAVPIAEIRRPEFVDTIEDLSQDEQAEYVDDLAERLQPADDLAPTVCHLDTGVARTHVLLTESLSPQDLHTVIGNSGFDRHGHGTSMAGLALLGDVDRHLAGSHTVPLAHRLESVRIRPERGEPLVQPVAYGDVTAQAVSLPEAVNVGRRRVFCMPVTATGDTPNQPGQPTLWSATIDALAVGTSVTRSGTELSLLGPPDPDARRLFIVSAGNVDQYAADHLGTSDLSAAQDPAQAWNVLTVGALTELDTVPTDPTYAGWGTVAPTGELSPRSRTSVVFGRSWPIKPDIVMEGGNVLHDGGSMFETCHPALALRTTGHANDKAVTAANATSAATAQAARLAAVTTAAYPEYWPETVRALLVHAAEWTPAMRQQLTAARTAGRREQQTMLRRYGWGVPTEDRVLYSTSQAVTLVIQDEFVPFVGEEFRCPAFRLHNLPWPREALQDLGAAPVTLRVTLSYFVEPTASRRGWRRRYAYPSHQLRFDLQGPLESEDEFVQRVNRDRRDEEESGRPTGSQVSWLVGPNQRNLGSLHQDIWDTTGVELARSGQLAVYPVGGWWKNNGTPSRIDQPVRYALVVSLRTTETDVDLYTPIATLLNVPTSIPIE
ncbi:S8 family peptidase [Pseudonocardia sp. EV170527-09]|uniref:S8 family peptidase n=1 Tax=Pseudonocardia sp. EV170527-09 TaxID=2603411 RepID=UPI001960A9E6|nr:S8 family peptidase [Pseudonocardia sp. EV170527-09]